MHPGRRRVLLQAVGRQDTQGGRPGTRRRVLGSTSVQGAELAEEECMELLNDDLQLGVSLKYVPVGCQYHARKHLLVLGMLPTYSPNHRGYARVSLQ